MLHGLHTPLPHPIPSRNPITPAPLPCNLPPESFNYCAVPLSARDAVLIPCLAVLAGAAFTGKLALIGVLLSGAVLGVVNYYADLGRLGNSVALWLGVQPPDLLLYILLPPLLADAALRIKFALFKRVRESSDVHGVLGCWPASLGWWGRGRASTDGAWPASLDGSAWTAGDSRCHPE